MYCFFLTKLYNKFMQQFFYFPKRIKTILLVSFFLLAAIGIQNYSYAATVKFRVVALNPSKRKVQTVPVKIYLPQEVKPTNIIDNGGLNIDFDSQNSLFYVYKNDLELKPSETRIFEVEIDDIWIIPKFEMDGIKTRADNLAAAFKNTDYSDQASGLAQTTSALIEEINKTQVDEGVSRSQHIGIYRTNVKSLAKIKERIVDLEKILQDAESGPLTPDIFSKSKFKSKVPTKTATWLIIFSVIIFIGLLSLVFFFTWYQQSKISTRVISEAKEESFGDKKDEETNVPPPNK